MTEGAQHQGQVVRVAAPELRGFVDDHQVVCPHVALGVPGRVLRDAHEGRQLREVTQQVRLPQELKPQGRTDALEQELAELFQDALGRHVRKIEGATEFDQFGVRAHFETGAELCDAQAPQRILRKGLWIDGAQRPGFEVTSPTVRIEHFAGEQVEAHAVDRQVASPRGGLEIQRRVHFDVEAAMSRPDLAVPSRQRKVDVEVGEPQHAEGATHRQDAAEALEQFLQGFEFQAEDLDVAVLGLVAEQAVAHIAAHGEGATAGGVDCASDLQRVLHDRDSPHGSGLWFSQDTATGLKGRVSGRFTCAFSRSLPLAGSTPAPTTPDRSRTASPAASRSRSSPRALRRCGASRISGPDRCASGR